MPHTPYKRRYTHMYVYIYIHDLWLFNGIWYILICWSCSLFLKQQLVAFPAHLRCILWDSGLRYMNCSSIWRRMVVPKLLEVLILPPKLILVFFYWSTSLFFGQPICKRKHRKKNIERCWDSLYLNIMFAIHSNCWSGVEHVQTHSLSIFAWAIHAPINLVVALLQEDYYVQERAMELRHSSDQLGFHGLKQLDGTISCLFSFKGVSKTWCVSITKQHNPPWTHSLELTLCTLIDVESVHQL